MMALRIWWTSYSKVFLFTSAYTANDPRWLSSVLWLKPSWPDSIALRPGIIPLRNFPIKKTGGWGGWGMPLCQKQTIQNLCHLSRILTKQFWFPASSSKTVLRNTSNQGAQFQGIAAIQAATKLQNSWPLCPFLGKWALQAPAAGVSASFSPAAEPGCVETQVVLRGL